MADLHPAVAAVLAVMPIDDEGETVVGFHRDGDGLLRGLNRDGVMDEMLLTTWGPPEPQAARYAAAARPAILRELAAELEAREAPAEGKIWLIDARWLRQRADEIEADASKEDDSVH